MTDRETADSYLPTPSGVDAEFYEQAADGVVHAQHCQSCDELRHPPRFFCPGCGSGDYDWTPMTGRGTVMGWTVTRRGYDPTWKRDIPYSTAVVELEEGVRLVGDISAVPPEALHIGLEVSTRVERRTPTFAFISFEPRNGGPGEASHDAGLDVSSSRNDSAQR